jgi:hypothetical protein
MSDRTTITRLRKDLARTRGKLRDAMVELQWRRKAMRGSRAEKVHNAKVLAERDAVFAPIKKLIARQEKLRKLTRLADDPRGNANERAVAAAMIERLRRVV